MPNACGGLIVIAPNKQSRSSATGFTGRRVRSSRTSAATRATRNSARSPRTRSTRASATTARPARGATTPTATAAAGRLDSTQFVHGIHGAEKRTSPYIWHAVSADDNFSKIVYPGVLARCEQCHVPGSYDFANSASADAAGLGSDGNEQASIPVYHGYRGCVSCPNVLRAHPRPLVSTRRAQLRPTTAHRD